MYLSPPHYTSQQSIQDLRRSYVEWMEQSGCNWCLTLNPNRSHAQGTEMEIIRRALADADKTLLGARFKKVDGRKRLLAFVAAEHLHSNLHFHLALRPGLSAPHDVELDRVRTLAEAWSKRVSSGSFQIEPVSNSEGWGRYISKEMWRNETEIMLSSMFWPERQRKHVL